MILDGLALPLLNFGGFVFSALSSGLNRYTSVYTAKFGNFRTDHWGKSDTKNSFTEKVEKEKSSKRKLLEMYWF